MTKIMAMAVIGIGFLATLSARGQAQAAFDAESGHWYENVVVPTEINWSDARREAEARRYKGVRGHLATITSRHEQQFIAQAFRGFIRERWLGGYQVEGAATDVGWRWITGEAWQGTNWDAAEPNDFHGDEGALEMYGGGTANKIPGVWNDDKPTSLNLGYIVEYEQVQDDAPPEVVIEAPQNEAVGGEGDFKAAVINVRDGEEGSGVGLSNVSVLLFREANGGAPAGFWNGSVWAPRQSAVCFRPATPYGTRWMFLFPTAGQGFGAGEYDLRAFAKDRAGNTGQSEVTHFTIEAGAEPVIGADPVASPVKISSATARAADDSVFIIFSATVDADRANGTAHYVVRVGDKEVLVDRAFSVLGGVELRLPPNTLRPNDKVRVDWDGLRDGRGREMKGKVESVPTR